MTQNDMKTPFFFRCAGQNDACSKVNFAAVQRTPSRGFSHGINPGISGICPIPAAESKVGYIPLFWHATVASSRCACTLRASAGARRGHDAGSALLRSKAVHTVLPGPRDVSCLVFFAQSARSCHFTLGGVGWQRSQRINLTQGVSR